MEGAQTTPADFTEGLQMLHRAADLNLTEVHFKWTVIALGIYRDFPRPGLRQNICPSQIYKLAKTTQNGVSFYILMKIS